MSIENKQPALQSPEVKSVDRLAERRAAQVDDIIDRASTQDKPSERLQTVTAFLDSIIEDSYTGELRGSRSEPYGLEDVQRQMDDLISVLNGPSKELGKTDPYDHVTRAGGIRAGFVRLIENPVTSGPILKALELDSFERRQRKAEEAQRKLGTGATRAIIARP